MTVVDEKTLMKNHLVYPLLFTITLIGCNSDDTSVGDISVIAINSGIEIRNRSSTTLYYFIVDQDALAAILWAPSVTDETPSVNPFSSKSIPFSEVLGYENETTTIIFYYWDAIDLNGQLQPGEVRLIEIDL